MNAIDRANKAKAILESQLFEEAFALVRGKLIEGMENCPLADTAVAEDFRRCLKLLRSVRLNLETAVNSGKIEQFRLTEAEKRKANPLRGIFR